MSIELSLKVGGKENEIKITGLSGQTLAAAARALNDAIKEKQGTLFNSQTKKELATLVRALREAWFEKGQP